MKKASPAPRSTALVACTLLASAACVAAACEQAPAEPGMAAEPRNDAKPAVTASAPSARATATSTAQAALATAEPSAKSAAGGAGDDESSGDPLKGKWSLDEATAGLPKGKSLSAKIETDLGDFECKLFDDKAPITVANFVGLARGLRPWKTPEGKWEKKKAYDGTTFHRVIKGFMIQGGDSSGDGTGQPGYVIPDELWEGAKHDRAGLLCMANRGPNTNGAQFFITDGAAPHLDKSYTIFGECSPTSLVTKIASVELEGREKPKSPPKIKALTISRK